MKSSKKAPARINPAGEPIPASQTIDELCINTIRTLAMDAVQQAKSGHPGTPMALAPLAYTLWHDFLRFDPDHPLWPNRDRFVLSNGHASMLLYATLHLTGVRSINPGSTGVREPAVTLEDIKRFRQLDSNCPGHPEYGLTSGIETTTGPLGQGCGNSVGMALAGRWLAQRFNRPNFEIFDYDVYVICSDGDMMEGVASEAASFAGHQMLGNLCWIYDSNRVTIEGHATRESSGKVLNAIASRHPWLVGGSADLAPSTRTRLTFESAGELEADSPGGRNLHFGVREHAMGAILNGLAVSKLRPFGAGFLIFSDYMKPPMRLAALMGLPVIYVFTHDSIGVGEDGPTHQPIEQLVALRSIPGLVTLRPADANEVVEAWRVIIALEDRPACLALSRQTLPTIDRARYASASGVSRGAYVLTDAKDAKPTVILIGTGSEVSLCIRAYEELLKLGIPARVVSMPSWELFEQQDHAYRDGVLCPDVTARVSVEMGSLIGWDRYVGATGARIGMRGFGSSAPLKDLLDRFGFTPAAIVEAAKEQIAKSGRQATR
jgi:transketolase